MINYWWRLQAILDECNLPYPVELCQFLQSCYEERQDDHPA